MKSVIINGDDFGHSSEVNAGIVRAHREGVLNSASLMVADRARDEAATAAKDNPGLDVGLHLVLCKGNSVLKPEQLAPIVDSAGWFPNSAVKAGFSYFFRRELRERLKAECRAQIETHLKLVGYLSHIDGHLNFHLHPTIGDLLIDLACEYRVPFLRLPSESLFANLALARDHLLRKTEEAIIFGLLCARMRRKMAERGLRSSDWLFGLHQTFNWSEAYMLGLIERLPDGVSEIYFHPSVGAGIEAPLPSQRRELELLISKSVKDAFLRHGVKLTTYRELARL